MTALIVKEDGLIYVNEVPDSSKVWPDDFSFEYAMEAAESTAVLCADQEQASGILYWNTDHHSKITFGSLVTGYRPGIYPIEGLTFSTYEKEFGTGMKSFANLSLEEK